MAHSLESIERAAPKGAEEWLPLAYEELHRLAAHKMAGEAPGQTLQPTALVHEAWLRLVGMENLPFQSRAHFFGAAAEAMRRILIDNARRKRAASHGGGQARVDIETTTIAAIMADDQMLAVDDAVEKLSAQDPLKAELVKLRFFVGLTIEEASEVLGISVPTAKRWWTYTRAWLYHEIKSQRM
jgi:RNA polymerase sigma factor (TIGR02999 family)